MGYFWLTSDNGHPTAIERRANKVWIRGGQLQLIQCKKIGNLISPVNCALLSL